MTTVTVDDAAALGYCRKGGRAFAERYGMDWLDFLKNGMDSARLDGIDDEMVKAVVAQARRRERVSNGEE